MKTNSALVGINAKGLVLFSILISTTGTIPAFADYNSTSSSILNSSMNPSPMTPSNLPYPPSYMVTNSTFYSGKIVSMGAPAPEIVVTTDKLSYNDGDKVMIAGTTHDYIADVPLTLIVKNPIGNIVKIDQITVGTDKTFSDSVLATGALWQSAGNYSIFVQYGSSSRTATTTFQFAGSHISQGNTIQVDGTNSSITYSITNGKILDIKTDSNSKALIVTIQTTGDGMLTITMPRSLIDAKKTDGTDDQFFILNDGQENDQFQEVGSTNTTRTLQIPFMDGTSQIEILGTFVVPEFGAIAALILTIAIVSIIAISTKTRLRFTHRV